MTRVATSSILSPKLNNDMFTAAEFLDIEKVFDTT